MIVSAAAGDGAFGWLGSRSGTFAVLRLSEVPEWFVYLAGGLVLYVAVVPAVATVFVLVRGLSRSATSVSACLRRSSLRASSRCSGRSPS